MNKKLISPVLLICLLVFGMVVVGCDNGTTNVGISYEKAPQVSSVTVTKTTNNLYFIVSWDAVAGERNSYAVYFKQDGKKSTSSVGNGQNIYKYDPATGDQIPNADLDKWSYRVTSLNAAAAGSYCFGVATSLGTYDVMTASSDIKWANSFTVTAGPQMSAISVTKTTNGSYLIASWDAIAGVNAYNVVLYYKSSSGYWNTYTNGSGQNSQTYAESDGSGSTNTDPSKWSYMYSNITTSYECYFAVSPVVSDISVLPSVATSAIVK